jgi:hypothetical protein
LYHQQIEQFYYFYLLSVAGHLYIEGRAKGQVLIPEEHHTLPAIIVPLDNQHLYFYHIEFDSSVHQYILGNLCVAVAPTWLIEPQDVSVLFQHPVSLHCQATGFPSPTITWMKAKG